MYDDSAQAFNLKERREDSLECVRVAAAVRSDKEDRGRRQAGLVRRGEVAPKLAFSGTQVESVNVRVGTAGPGDKYVVRIVVPVENSFGCLDLRNLTSSAATERLQPVTTFVIDHNAILTVRRGTGLQHSRERLDMPALRNRLHTALRDILNISAN